MSYEQEFLKDFEEWLQSQISINQMAMDSAKKVLEEDKDERAADAYIRYESKLDAYRFLQGKWSFWTTSLLKGLSLESLSNRHFYDTLL